MKLLWIFPTPTAHVSLFYIGQSVCHWSGEKNDNRLRNSIIQSSSRRGGKRTGIVQLKLAVIYTVIWERQFSFENQLSVKKSN